MVELDVYLCYPERLAKMQGTGSVETQRCAWRTLPAAERSPSSEHGPSLDSGEPFFVDPSASLPGQAALRGALAVRREVFVDEQGVPLAEEQDAYDDEAVHAVLCLDGQALATARLVPKADHAGKIGRVAVRRPWRGYGLGALLMEVLTQQARRLGMRELVLDAQIQVLGFYETLGYQAEGETFLDAGIWHRRMRCRLSGIGEALTEIPSSSPGRS